MKLKKWSMASLIIYSLLLNSCVKSAYSPIKDMVTTGSYFYITQDTSPVKAWANLAYTVAKSIAKTDSIRSLIKIHGVYIVPGKDTVFEKNYRELLATAMVKENFLVSKSPDTSLILIFNSYVIPDLSEVLVNTSLYNNGSIIFRDSSIFNLKNNSHSITEYEIKVLEYRKIPIKNDYKIYKLVDK
ncbi:hypothetical protein JCM13304A_11350 [Desulfothermus okinawensis JCM 13304]